MNRRTVFAVAALAAAALAAAAHGATIHTFPGCAASLQQCIDAASSGDTVRLATSTPVVEILQIQAKGLRLEAAPGFTPVLKGSILAVGGPQASQFAFEGLTVEGRIVVAGGAGDLDVTIVRNRVQWISQYFAAIEIYSTVQAADTITFAILDNQVNVAGNGGAAQCAGIGYSGAFDDIAARGIIAGNRVTVADCGQGAAIRSYTAHDETAVAILGNRVEAPGTGAGIVVFGGANGTTATIAGNLVTGQKTVAGASGAILADASGDAKLDVTIVNNTAAFNDAGLVVNGRRDLGAEISAVVANNVVTHSLHVGLRLDNEFTATIAAHHNLVFGNLFDAAAVDTIHADPRYVAAPGDLRLAVDSPAVNSGHLDSVYDVLERDLDGRPRVIGGAVDRGAYEYPGPFPPAAPTQLTATATSAHAILLDWEDRSSDEDSFLIERLDGTQFVSAGEVGPDQSSVLIPALEAATRYTFRVRGHGTAGASAPSNEASAETWASADLPAAPSHLVATLTGPDRVRLEWRDESSDEVSFLIQRRSGGDFATVASATAGSESIEISGLEPATLYGFRVRADNRAGSSGPSNIAEITTPALCHDGEVACLGGGRFAVAVSWTTADGATGSAQPRVLTPDSASFWFFDPANVELLVKVLDGCGVNDRFWVFATGLTNAEVRLTVTDTWTGETALYVNPQHHAFEPIQDTSALAGCSAGGDSTDTAEPATASSGCASGDDALCVQGGRYRVEALWRTADGQTGRGHAVALTGDSGTFWFFDPANVELVVKVLDACDQFGRFWVFAGGLTNVEVELRATDQETGETRVYRNPLDQPFRPLQDTDAFATCR